jgi:hypothetical protein
MKHVEFLDKNKFGKLVHLLVLLKIILFTMHGHMNVKKNVKVPYPRSLFPIPITVLSINTLHSDKRYSACSLVNLKRSKEVVVD